MIPTLHTAPDRCPAPGSNWLCIQTCKPSWRCLSPGMPRDEFLIQLSSFVSEVGGACPSWGDTRGVAVLSTHWHRCLLPAGSGLWSSHYLAYHGLCSYFYLLPELREIQNISIDDWSTNTNSFSHYSNVTHSTVLIRHSHESKVRRWGRVQLQPSVKLWSRRYKAVHSCGPATAGWGMVSIPRDHWVMVSGQMLPIQLSVFDDVQYDTFDGHFDGCILAYIMCRGGIYQHPLQSGLKCGAWPLALALATHQWVPH